MSTHPIGFTHPDVTRIQPNARPQRKPKRAAFESKDQPEAKRRKVDSEGRTYHLPTTQSSYHGNQFSDDFAKVAQQIIQKFAEAPAPENKWDFQPYIPPAAVPTPIVVESSSSSSGGTMTQAFYNDGIMQRHPDEKNEITGDGLVGNTSAESKQKLQLAAREEFQKKQLAALAKFQMKQRQEELKEAEEKQGQRQLEPISSQNDFLTINEDSDNDDGFIGSLGKLNIKSKF